MTDSNSAIPNPSALGDFFATTHWTVVMAAGGGTPEAAQALEELCRNYWYPLYAFARRHGQSKEDAEDATQGFFEQFLSRNYLQNLSGEKGRFRAFLLASFKHFLSNERDRAGRLKRGGGVAALSLDWADAETRYQIDPVDHLSPDKLYDRAWAMTLLGRTLARLRAEHAGNRAVFDRLKPFLAAGKGAISYSEAAAALGMSEGAARVAVHRLRARYRELLRDEIRQTLSNPAAVDGEMQALFAAFG
jgi:RNA polymerase sigma factor (sigma-70 family)